MKKYSKVGNQKNKTPLKRKLKTTAKKSSKKNLATINLPIELLKNIQKNKKLLKSGKIKLEELPDQNT